jgi:hypothetical protein
MLEFIEVFWLRDGFDVICGNPPWVLASFDVVSVISEKFPEVILKGMNAPNVRANKQSYFDKCIQLESIYNEELIESTCTNVFTNSACVYPYLQGIKTDLYMCILETSYDMISNNGFIGMVHPESIYDTAKLSKFRGEAYHRLRYHFQFHNEYRLFAEVHHETTYGINIYGNEREQIKFYSIHNLYHPNTIDASFSHDGLGLCHGVKYKGKWNVVPHKDRIVEFDRTALDVLSSAFEEEITSNPKLINTQSESTIEIVEKLARFKTHVCDYQSIITVGFNETTAADDGMISREVYSPHYDDYCIYNGPHVYVSTPLYKMPRPYVDNNSSYDVIDHLLIDEDFVPTTCFKPRLTNSKLHEVIKGFIIGQDREGNAIYDSLFDYYKLGISEWVGPTSERTLSGGILPPTVYHVGTIVSTTFKDPNMVVELCGIINSLILDFYIKITGASHVKQYRIEKFPLGIEEKYKDALYVRVLMLNCLTNSYSDLWHECWRDNYLKEKWSIVDSRLKPFGSLERYWSWNVPLRNYFERRQALVEIDVIIAMALGLSLKDLESVYSIQFPVLEQNENDTWYDQKGNIVFTCSKGLTGVGVDRSVWNTIREMKPGETYVHTIEKSELYKGQQVTYYAPFTRCDRIEDYRRAWAHFEPIFNK